MAVALVVGNMVGSGVFLLPASLAAYGANSLTGWLASTAGAVLLACVLAALSRAFPTDGGPYVYTRAAFGELTAFVVAWGYWVSVWVGNAAIATGGVSYLIALAPSMAVTPGLPAVVTLVILWALTAVNCYGVRAAGWVQAVTTVTKLVPLLAVALVGVFVIRRDPGANLAAVPLSLEGTTAAATLTMWALLGFESATVPAEKVEDPGRTVPRATIAGTLVAAIVCALACTFVLLMVPADRLAASNAPFADAARLFWGDRAATLVALFAAVSTFGCLNGWILVQGELPYVLGRDGAFPRVFSRVSARRTPVASLVFTSTLISALVAMNFYRRTVDLFTFMILLATCANLVAYLLCAMALLVLLARGRLPDVRRTAPWLAVAGALGSAYSLWAIAGAGREAVAWGSVLLLAGLPVYGVMRRGRRTPGARA
jgi:APA family basic amino acid/polyamine antiporter